MRSSADTDTVLVEAARGGDVASYGQLVERYEAVAHRTAYMLGAGDETADVVQEAFMKAYLALPRFRSGEPFRPWLLTIVANLVRNRHRWHRTHRAVPLALLGDDVEQPADRSPERLAEDAETSRQLRDAMWRLPAGQRDVVACRYLLDMSEEDTARVLAVPRGTVKSRLSRALRALEDRLGDTMTAHTDDQERHGA